jgi:hypothetical protein
MQLIYLSPVPWTSFAQRPHKFVDWFHARTRSEVVWVDPYPTRFPLLSDFHRLGTHKDGGEDTFPQWLRVVRPSALPIEPLPASRLINGVLWRSLLKDMDVFARRDRTMLAMGKPSVLAVMLTERLDKAISVYDAMDDFPSFYSGFSRLAMQHRKRTLVDRVTHVLVSSTALKRHWGTRRPDVRLVRNGLDPGILPTYKGEVIRERKILGYVGTIGAWFDWEWVVALAKTRPVDLVRLIGPVCTPAPHRLPENIEILPPRAHPEALLAMRDFDIGLIPFKNTELTVSVDPIKYYEYRALGLPIISTKFGEMELRGDEEGVLLSKNRKDLNGLVEKALGYRANEEKAKQFIAANTWEARFAEAGILS